MSKPIKAYQAAVTKGYKGTSEEFEAAFEEEQSAKFWKKFNEVGARFTCILLFSVVLSLLWLWGITTMIEDYATAVPNTFTVKMFAVLTAIIGATYYIVTFGHELLTSDDD